MWKCSRSLHGPHQWFDIAEPCLVSTTLHRRRNGNAKASSSRLRVLVSMVLSDGELLRHQAQAIRADIWANYAWRLPTWIGIWAGELDHLFTSWSVSVNCCYHFRGKNLGENSQLTWKSIWAQEEWRTISILIAPSNLEARSRLLDAVSNQAHLCGIWLWGRNWRIGPWKLRWRWQSEGSSITISTMLVVD